MRRLIVVVALLACSLLPACSGSSQICDAVKNGQDPVVASGASYTAAGGADKADQAEKLRDAAGEIRSSCPEREGDAKRLEAVASSLGVPAR